MRAQVTKLLLLWLVLSWSAEARAHEKADEKLPPPTITMRVIAPSAQGPWLLRIDNEGEEPIRIAADVRLLRFEVRVPSDKPVSRSYQGGWAPRAAVCDGPSTFGLADHFPGGRELVVDPGHSYTEQFDPRLICFGKNSELLVPGAYVHAYYGWKPRPTWSRKMEAAPFVADAAHAPRRFRPLRRLTAAPLVLSHAPPVMYGDPAPEPDEGRGDQQVQQPEAPNPPAAVSSDDDATTAPPSAQPPSAQPPSQSAERASTHRPRAVIDPPRRQETKDELAARMTLTASHHTDAARPTDVSLSVQAHNTGQRELFIALRSRMLSFMVDGPTGRVRCQRQSSGHQVPRDLFRTLHHGKHVHMEVSLSEVCPPGTFDRPGLYRAVPILLADANGAQYGLSAITGTVTTRDPGAPSGTHRSDDDGTLIRLRKGRMRFYRERPMQIPTRVLPK
jgi:hypothetical protein